MNKKEGSNLVAFPSSLRGERMVRLSRRGDARCLAQEVMDAAGRRTATRITGSGPVDSVRVVIAAATSRKRDIEAAEAAAVEAAALSQLRSMERLSSRAFWGASLALVVSEVFLLTTMLFDTLDLYAIHPIVAIIGCVLFFGVAMLGFLSWWRAYADERALREIALMAMIREGRAKAN